MVSRVVRGATAAVFAVVLGLAAVAPAQAATDETAPAVEAALRKQVGPGSSADAVFVAEPSDGASVVRLAL